MATKMFLNLPVKDLNRSMEFFKRMGFAFNLQYTNEKGACMVISDTIYVMLLIEDFFTSFTKKKVPDTLASAQAIIGISAESRETVDLLVEKAFDAGAGVYNDPQDMGFMYSRSFADLDGHLWEVFHMEEVT